MSTTLFGLLGGAAGADLAEKGYDRLGDIGQKAYDEFAGEGGLADKLAQGAQFKPYTITSGTGSQFGMTQGANGMEYNLNMSPEEQAFQQQRMSDAGMFFGQAAMPVAQREQEVYGRMLAGMQPEFDRQRLAMEERMLNQGRGGVRTAMFGGTPEQFAMEKAQAEAQNQAFLQAMQFTGEEQDRMARLGSGMLASSYVPQAQLIGALKPGMNAAESYRMQQNLANQGYGETYATGLEALLQSGLGQANLLGGLGGQLATASLGGLFG